MASKKTRCPTWIEKDVVQHEPVVVADEEEQPFEPPSPTLCENGAQEEQNSEPEQSAEPSAESTPFETPKSSMPASQVASADGKEPGNGAESERSDLEGEGDDRENGGKGDKSDSGESDSSREKGGRREEERPQAAKTPQVSFSSCKRPTRRRKRRRRRSRSRKRVLTLSRASANASPDTFLDRTKRARRARLARTVSMEWLLEGGRALISVRTRLPP